MRFPRPGGKDDGRAGIARRRASYGARLRAGNGTAKIIHTPWWWPTYRLKRTARARTFVWGGKLRVVAPLLALVLCGCSSLPRAWVRPDGGPIDSAQFQLDDRYCRGQAENAAVQGARTSTINSPLGADPQDRTAYIGCMADSGYAAAQEQGTGPAVAADASPPAGR
jgi:hypothetical protein